MTNQIITRRQVADNQRINHTANIFGVQFPLRIEPAVYSFTEMMAAEYNGGYWDFYALSNCGFYMTPDLNKTFQVSCENGFEGKLSGDALGVTVCLYTYSHFSFSDNQKLAEVCARQYHWLRDFMLEHEEVRCILGAVD
ncbi:antirestriction protein [Nitrosomonas ureae]|uniref:Antirestriction protein n=1 Tax=Nitrosomonas ureae TaxID=44577 RepID=A0A1H9G6U7_9PROT|nr:antirestriction protein [Nitrosomonas ureae]SEQ45740.1 Antirestriction protein [Nitrosomonas ureae]